MRPGSRCLSPDRTCGPEASGRRCLPTARRRRLHRLRARHRRAWPRARTRTVRVRGRPSTCRRRDRIDERPVSGPSRRCTFPTARAVPLLRATMSSILVCAGSDAVVRQEPVAGSRSSLVNPLSVSLTTKTAPSGRVTPRGAWRPRVIKGPSAHAPVAVANRFVLENGCSTSLSPPMTSADPSDRTTIAGSLRGLLRLGASVQTSLTGSYRSARSLPATAGPG